MRAPVPLLDAGFTVGLDLHPGERFGGHRRPVVVNACGALDSAALPDRARGLAAVRGAAERRGIGRTRWDCAEAFGFLTRRDGTARPVPALLDAPIPPRIAGRAPRDRSEKDELRHG